MKIGYGQFALEINIVKTDKKSTIKQITDYVGAAYPILYLYTTEEHKTLEILKRVAEDVGIQNIYRYNMAEGLLCLTGTDKRLKYDNRENILDAIKFITNSLSQKSFVVFQDIHNKFQEDPMLVRLFKNAASDIQHKGLMVTIFIISSVLQIPSEIEKDIVVIDIPLPSRDEIGEKLNDFLNHNKIGLTDILKGKFIEALSGLTDTEISNILNLCLQDTEITEEDLDLIISQKQQLIKKGGVLEFVSVKERIEDIGGLSNLKEWLKSKKIIFDKLEKAREFGVNTPKGILLFGMPGCGKSLAAKAIATYFELPLLRLDMGMILGPYVGQSEENIRRAIKLAESIAPSVLWIDELEKAFVGVGHGSAGGSSDVSIRIFGTILTWMQEKTKPVFVVATSNNISGMPPEFMRKGRFDEIFFVDFPQNDEVKEIINVHLKKRKKNDWIDKLDYSKLLSNIKNFSGADIEAIVMEVVEDNFIKGKDSTNTDEFLNKIKEFKPLSVTMKDEIDELKKTVKKYDSKKAN